MRSVIDAASETGHRGDRGAAVRGGPQILAKGLVPIIEPEVTISIADKAEAEEILLDQLTRHLDGMPADQKVMLKLTLPDMANRYASLVRSSAACCGWLRFRAAIRAMRRTRSWRRTVA